MIRPAVLGLVALLTVAGAPAAFAQGSPADSAGSRLPGDSTVFELPDLEVWASILTSPGPRVGVVGRGSVVDAGELSAWRPHLLTDVLTARASVTMYDDLGSPFKTTLVSRGFTAGPVVGLPQGVSVFLDGVPVNEPDAGQVNLDLLPLEHVARVELLQGTASLLGPHSLGGAINLITRRGGTAPAAEVELAAGSHALLSGNASVAGVRGPWSYYSGGTFRRQEGWRQLTGAEQYDALVNIGHAAGRRSFNLQALAARSYAETAGSLPLSVYVEKPDSNLSAGDFEDLEQFHLALSGGTPAGPGTASFRAHVRGHSAERFNVNQAADPDVRSFSRNRTVGTSADWRWAREAAGGWLGLRVGAGGSASATDIRIYAERLDPRLTTHVRSPIRKGAAYGTVSYAVGRVTGTAGGRFDLVRVPFRNVLDPTRDTTSTFLRLSPRAGLEVELSDRAVAHASVGRSFRAPAVIELACADPENPCPLPFALGDDPPLDPVVATTYEAALRWSVRGLRLGTAVFRTDVRDDIFLLPYSEEGEPEGSTIDGFFQNIGATRRGGVEADAELTARRGHRLHLSYAFTSATFQLGGVEIFSIRGEAGPANVIEPGDRLPLVPAHTLRVGGALRLPHGLDAGALIRYTGERWLRGDDANEERPLNAYWIVNARAGYPLGQWRLDAVIENLLDARYEAFGTFNINRGAAGAVERFLTPGSPRSLRLVLSWTAGAG